MNMGRGEGWVGGRSGCLGVVRWDKVSGNCGEAGFVSFLYPFIVYFLIDRLLQDINQGYLPHLRK